MNQCVPNWEVEENHQTPPVQRIAFRDHSNSSSLTPDVPSLEYEVAELTWENGQLAMHGLGPPRLTFKTPAASTPVKYTWEKQPTAAAVAETAGGGTLESVVNQATAIVPGRKPTGLDDAACGGGDDELVPWFASHQRQLPVSANSHTLTMDALVPSSNKTRIISDGEACYRVPGVSTRVVGCSGTHVGSCSAATAAPEQADERLARVGSRSAHPLDRSSSRSVSGSATCGRDSRQVTADTCERDIVTPWLISASLGLPENTSSGKRCTKTGDDYDSACHSRNEREAEEEEKKRGNVKSCISAKRSRAAAVHNQSERKRRDKINQRMKTLQKLVPNSSKNSHTDKASMLDEVIEYLKQLQAQVHIMSRMSMPWMMLPLALQQQLQMSMMAPMGLGMNMGVGMGMGMGVMDLNSMARPNIPGIPPIIHPTPFMPPATSWDGGLGDRVAAAASPPSAMPDPLAAFLACQSQPMTMDAYGRMAALYQQCFQQPPDPAASKNKLI